MEPAAGGSRLHGAAVPYHTVGAGKDRLGVVLRQPSGGGLDGDVVADDLRHVPRDVS